MKETIEKIVPLWMLKWYRDFKVAKFKNRSAEDVFTEIYKTNRWKSSESISGEGSELKQVETLIKELDSLIANLNISSILDIPCGDFNWMRHVDLSKVNYVGADIVNELIEANIEKFKDYENVNFIVLDLINNKLPKKDLIIIRDCLVHLSFDHIFKSIENVKKSGSKYLFTTTYPNHNSNLDIITGDWRRLNLMQPPFNFPEPLLIINENCTESNGRYADKSMLLWDISKL